VRLTFAGRLCEVTETNGYKDDMAPVAYDGDTLTLDFGRYAVRTFAVKLEESDTKASSGRFEYIGLPYDRRITTPRDDLGAGEFSEGISVPSELWEDTIVSSGVPFRMGAAGEANAVVCRGQKIFVPAGAKKISVLAASACGDKTAVFGIGDKNAEIGVQDFHDNVGAWDQLVNGHTPLIKRDEIAHTFTHTHDKDGDRLYLFAYLFRYEFDLDRADTFVLPDDPDIIVAAATASSDGGCFAPWCDLYDRVERSDAPEHTLTVVSCSGKEKAYRYQAGKTALVRTGGYEDGYVFKGWDGDCIAAEYGPAAVVRMPDHDVTVRILAEKLGHDILLDRPAKAIHEFNEMEKAGNAVNGNDRTKWCAASEDGKLWLEVDAGKTYKVNRWFVMHGGAVESPDYNTSDFSLQIRSSEDEEWKTVDAVTGNQDNQTLREFPAAEGRFFRLWIDKATQYGDHTARIYMFQVFEQE
ncbi:MAG: discoidin domain-containing protein, partial [Clostridiales bacterium]|nr:discoidin domain-containing protein [Clostridiales bacterium]